ncbi:MAG: hypothetical protein PHP87_04430 [Syntrophomonas sp.]|uniref:hypothetical protein n=1 Tax=Syntrophomonas sp. TaxID=2053627 RepID=UPI00260DCADC|nr:hypothetical protein [Syntrophomonas sp.]MDD4626317.1 hypothetical protein [Syntrophomonas sp.]
MKILVAIDDTDNIDSRGTGELADLLSNYLEEKGWGKGGAVTRHQLLIHPDIPYTSHNSSMCFGAEIEASYLAAYTEFAERFLEKESAEGSDPGLCVAEIEQMFFPDELIAFGYRAKQVVLTKSDAYELAKKMDIHLSEHGGSGQGVIGALAGVALRLTANDGRFRGKLKVKAREDLLSVREIKKQTPVTVVRSLDGTLILGDNTIIRIGEKLKAVLLEGQCTLLVFPTGMNDPAWQSCTTSQLRKY